MEADEEAVAVMRIGIAHAVIGILQMMMPTELLAETTIVAVVARALDLDHRPSMTDITAQVADPEMGTKRGLEIEAPVVTATVAENEPRARLRSLRHHSLQRMSVIVVQSSFNNWLLD